MKDTIQRILRRLEHMKKALPQDHGKTVCPANGFTIIEVLIAMFILAVGIFGVTKLQLTSIKANHSAMQHTRAATIAQDQVERLMLLPFDDNALKDDAEKKAAKEGYTLKWNVTNVDLDLDGTVDIKRINLKVEDLQKKKRADINFIRNRRL